MKSQLRQRRPRQMPQLLRNFKVGRKFILNLKKVWNYTYMMNELEALSLELEYKAAQIEKVKTNFLNNVYHEIRTPLNSIVGFSSLIEQPLKPSDNLKAYLGIINKSSAEFLKVIDELVQASMLQAEMLKPQLEYQNIGNIMREIYEVFSHFRRRCEKDSIALLLSIPNDITNLVVYTDRAFIQQIITQLLSNAFKYTQKGTVEFGYRLRKEQLEFFVFDSGLGLSMDKRDQIFKAFVKVEEYGKNNDGIGLGLTIAERMVTLLGGNIWYTPKTGRGSAFYFVIPMQSIKQTKEASLVDTNSKRITEQQLKRLLAM